MLLSDAENNFLRLAVLLEWLGTIEVQIFKTQTNHFYTTDRIEH